MACNRTTELRLERLETRETPATFVSPTTVTYQDIDGDDVRVVFSKPLLTATNAGTIFSFVGGAGVNGDNTVPQQLTKINLTSLSAAASGLNITTTATKSPLHGGDGFGDIGVIDSTGNDLGIVKIDGDLCKFTAGDVNVATSGLKGLIVDSIGRLGFGTGAPLLDMHSVVQGKLDLMRVKRDVFFANFDVEGGVDGKIGLVQIGGSMIAMDFNNRGQISATGDINTVRIGGNLEGAIATDTGRIFSAGRIGFVSIGGDVIGGFNTRAGSIEANLGIGIVRIRGSVYGSGGVESGRISSLAGIDSISIGGSLIGGTGNSSGNINTIGEIKSIQIGGNFIGGTAAGTSNLTESGQIRAQRIGSLVISGSMISGRNYSTGTFGNNGIIRVADDIGSILIKGSIIGNSNFAVISARGQANPIGAVDLAIGKLTVLGRVDLANIIAGLDINLQPANADAQIGSVFIGGDMMATNITAGVTAGNTIFGDSDDAKFSGGVKDTAVVSRIGSVTVKGHAVGFGGLPGLGFGIVAETVGAVQVNGTSFLLDPVNDDDFRIGASGNFKVHEV